MCSRGSPMTFPTATVPPSLRSVNDPSRGIVSYFSRQIARDTEITTVAIDFSRRNRAGRSPSGVRTETMRATSASSVAE